MRLRCNAADVIRRAEPDLVALQEIDERVPRSGSIDQAAELGKLTGMHHAFGSFFDYSGGRYGMAILTRQPLANVANHRLPDGAEPRTALAVTVKPLDDGPELVFVGVHFYHTEPQRLAQAEALLEALRDETRPVIIAGDFNSFPDSPVLKRFAADWNIPGKQGNRFTFPSDRPSIEIDYILFRPADAFVPGTIHVLGEPVVSDHCPLLLDLALPSAQQE